MSGIQPVAVYAMRVPPGDIMVPAVPEFAAMFRVTMAAIDPSAEPELEDPDDKRPPRATLKLVRVPDDMLDDDDESDDEDFDLDDDEDDDDEDEDEEVNGGPSEKKSKTKTMDEDADMEDEDEDEDEDDDAEAIAQLAKIMKLAKGKGKAKAVDGEDDADDEDDSDDESLEMDEVVICTLDPEKNFQQTLDFVVGEGEKVFFKVSGTHTVHLTGNYVIPQDDGSASLYDEDDEGEDYDLSPDEDELDALEDADEESDALDDLDDPRIAEVDSEEEEALNVVKGTGKGKNKRPAVDEDEDEGDNLDDIMAKSLKKDDKLEQTAAATTNGEAAKKLSKAEKKRLKKLKKNDGEAVSVDANTSEGKKEAAQTNGDSEKKVQFAKNLVQGPTPSATPAAKSDSKPSAGSKEKSASVGVKDIQGVTVDDRKIGNGPAAKKGSRLEMRYIGKLDNGSVFDSNKSGKPFSFKLGAGEVIKGWDIGLQGIQVGGERRLIIPAHLAYGNKALPGIPKNSKLTFDIKCLAVK
ncbi:peptidylprolyl isomerase [Cladophialophora yegresii CBS 114405]|uniref:peptidylprolyl isomerase n=1 Tax=Cladophialophora yegresii CBS 114405 TaxID=1182544 RepID=W9VLF7_9EURO|nr:peptidylprolyl isomerase [Cladophialophora yegresii CBS 114405]EXJ53830.1 peptidylprolyl isomerase [Cladophialophora yegresii CBS 114405]